MRPARADAQPMATAHGTGLRAGWYPDLDGELRYRFYDGYEWTEQTAAVPLSRRARFPLHREALERRLAAIAAGDLNPGVRPGGKRRLRPEEQHPGGSPATAAFICSLLALWFVAIPLARRSNAVSNGAGLVHHPRARAAIGISIVWILATVAFAGAYVVLSLR